MGGAGFAAEGPVLVLGATGTVGRELVRQLAAGGAAVRAFVRDEARGRGVLGRLAVEYSLGDLAEPETVKRAARGCARLFLLTPDGPGQVALATGAARAAVEAGVGYIVSLSSSDSAPDAPFAWARAHHAIEEHLENLGVHYTHLRPHYFMPNLLHALEVESGFARAAAADGSRQDLCGGRARHRGVCGRGAGRRAARAAGGAHRRRGVHAREAAAVLAENSAIPIRYDDQGPEQHLETMLARGVERAEADSISLLYELGRTGYLDRVTGEVEAITGRPPRRLGAFATEVAAPMMRDRYKEAIG